MLKFKIIEGRMNDGQEFEIAMTKFLNKVKAEDCTIVNRQYFAFFPVLYAFIEYDDGINIGASDGRRAAIRGTIGKSANDGTTKANV